METSEIKQIRVHNGAAILEWNGKYYSIKMLRPIFIEETAEIVVVTVYTYYY